MSRDTSRDENIRASWRLGISGSRRESDNGGME